VSIYRASNQCEYTQITLKGQVRTSDIFSLYGTTKGQRQFVWELTRAGKRDGKRAIKRAIVFLIAPGRIAGPARYGGIAGITKGGV